MSSPNFLIPLAEDFKLSNSSVISHNLQSAVNRNKNETHFSDNIYIKHLNKTLITAAKLKENLENPVNQLSPVMVKSSQKCPSF